MVSNEAGQVELTPSSKGLFLLCLKVELLSRSYSIAIKGFLKAVAGSIHSMEQAGKRKFL